MKDYSESMINTREFLRRTEDCLLDNNHMGAYHYAMQAFREVQDLLEYCLEKSKDLKNS